MSDFINAFVGVKYLNLLLEAGVKAWLGKFSTYQIICMVIVTALAMSLGGCLGGLKATAVFAGACGVLAIVVLLMRGRPWRYNRSSKLRGIANDDKRLHLSYEQAPNGRRSITISAPRNTIHEAAKLLSCLTKPDFTHCDRKR
jgi:hypothetical protein